MSEHQDQAPLEQTANSQSSSNDAETPMIAVAASSDSVEATGFKTAKIDTSRPRPGPSARPGPGARPKFQMGSASTTITTESNGENEEKNANEEPTASKGNLNSIIVYL